MPVDAAGPEKAPSRLLEVGFVRRFLRFPLYNKIVVANSVFVAIAALAGVFLALAKAGVWGTALTVGVVGGSVLLAVAITALANAFLVRVALSPLTPLEATVRDVEQGDLDARVAPSALADANLQRLTGVFNDMLDRLEEGRDRQQALAIMVLEAEERERRWLARELYDDTAQILAATLLQIRVAARSEDKATSLEPIRQEIVGALEGIRKIARRLRPPELDELGLAAAVEAHARTLAEVGAVSIQCRTEPVDTLLSREARLAFYRIVQEALTNAVRHARAEHIDVRIGTENGRVTASIEDDGQGFDRASVFESPGGSFGLVGIQERAAYLGGAADVDSAPGAGTRVRVAVPTSRPAAGAGRLGRVLQR